jgi:uncharacterized protein
LRRFVIDANILASGSIDPHRDSPPTLIYRGLLEIRFEAIVCPELMQEIAETLSKPYFLERVGGKTAVQDIVTGIAEAATTFKDPANPDPVLRDPEDDYLIALARTAKAEAIVTGDRDLLDHADLQPPAITARNACGQLGLHSSS